MTAFALLAFLPSIAIGFLLMLLAWPGAYRRSLALKLALGAGIGQGVTSCLYFAFSLFFRPRNRAYWLIEAALLVGLLALVLLQRKAHPADSQPARPAAQPLRWISIGLLAAFTAAGVTAAASFVIQSLMQPHGIQDAWNIWNMRARFLYRGGANWKDLFSPVIYWLNHPDYPFLITAGTARAWNVFYSETTLAPMLQAAIYAAALVGMLCGGLWTHKSKGQAALAGLLLVSSSWFVLFSAWQISDVPLDFFIVSSLFVLIKVLSAPAPGQPGLLYLLGLTAGLAAWTKNEGILYLVILAAVWLAARLRARPALKTFLGEGLAVLGGLMLPLLVLAALKLFLAPPSDLFAGQSSDSILTRVLDLSRYTQTLAYLWQSILGFSRWGIPVLFVLLLYGVCFRPTARPKEASGLAAAALVLALLAGGYFAIYIITPHDLVWHLRTSTDRLVFHLYPPALLILFWAVQTPEEILTPDTQSNRS